MTPRKLGKKPARHDPRTLRLANYVEVHLPLAPSSVDYVSKVGAWPMYRNDEIGDCTCAAAAHQIQAWTQYGRSHEIGLSDGAVLQAYERVGGYVPGDPSTDMGAVELDVLKYWRTHGIGGHKIGAFASVHPRSEAYVKDAIYLFGGLYVGVSLPMSAQGQAVWEVPAGGPFDDGEPGSWGGHAVPILGYDERGLTCITWGAALRMTWDFLSVYCDESYAIFSTDFIRGNKAPNGFNIQQLIADLAKL